MTVDYSDLTYSLAGIKRRNPYDARRQYAYGQLKAGTDTSPVQHPLQAAARLAQALVGGWTAGQADRDEQASVEKQNSALAAAMAEPDPQKRIAMLSASNPELGARLSGQLAVEQAKIAQQQAGLQTGAGQLAAGYNMPSGGPQQAGDPASRIAGIESGGRYDAVGPVANQQGHRAYGKFQVLEPNVGPWTQEVLGKAMTPQEFIANPQAQEAVFKAKFGQYRQQYGSDEAAARAWFAGPGGMNNPNASDVNGMTVQRYGQQFAQSGVPAQNVPGGLPQMPVAQGNSPSGMPPAPTAQGMNGPAVIAPPAIPEVPRPTQPSQQVITQAESLLKAGQFGPDPRTAIPAARAWVEQQMQRDWQVAQKRAELEYQQRYGDYKEDRKHATEKGDPKFTEDANKAHAYALRVSKALPLLEQMVSSPEGAPGRIDRMVTNLPVLGNTLAGPRGERFDQITRDVVNAILRRESGATITDPEFKNAYLQYIPQPGDSPETAQLKLENIRTQLKAFADTANRTPDVYGMSGNRGSTVAPAAVPAPRNAAPAAGAVEDGYRFKGGNPADPNSWEKVQ